MIGGSRLGASFVVLVIGLLDDLRHRRTEKRSAYIGVAALVATAIVYVPAMALGCWACERGLFAGLRIEGRDLASLHRRRLRPDHRFARSALPRFCCSCSVSSVCSARSSSSTACCPTCSREEGPVSLAGRVVYRPWVMFLIGARASPR